MKTLYEYAKANKLTISDIARAIDIGPGYLYKIIAGTSPLSAKVIRQLAAISGGQITEKMIKATRSVCRCCGRPLK